MNEIAGFVSGLVGAIVGHPFDTVKIHSQLYQYKSDYVSYKSIIKKYGYIGLYKGLSVPLASRPIIKTMLFSTYENVYKLQKPLNINNYNKMAIAGFTSGLTSGIVSCPIEFVRNRYQLGFNIFNIDIKKIKFGIRETLIRDCPYYTIFWPLYEYLKKNKVPAAGGITGCICWAIIYPIDVLKSKVQSEDIIKINKYTGIYKGLPSTLLRAFPVHFSTLFVYEYIKIRI